MSTADSILDFWFTEIKPAQWWVKDSKLDAQITDRFMDVHKQAIAGELDYWRQSASGRLAEIIILDQFSRNIYRDTAAAFAQDAQALTLSQHAIAMRADLELTQTQRLFVYLPFMHSESLHIHEKAILLFEDLGLAANLKFELKHKIIIERFGRYPHRNKILNRQSTEEEMAFLLEPGSSF